MNKDKIIFVGDIHGAFQKLKWTIAQNYKNAYIIQVGDFGVGFKKNNYYSVELEIVNNRLRQLNCHLYAIRGNHDNPSWFQETVNPFDLSNITLLADYSELELLNQKILLVGGAVSIDRVFRTPNIDWWEDEKFVLKTDEEFPYSEKQYDIVVTHTRPAICGAFKGFANIHYWCNKDSDLKEKLIAESQQMDILYQKTKPKHWFYGHFHESNSTIYEGTQFKCLNIDEHYMLNV